MLEVFKLIDGLPHNNIEDRRISQNEWTYAIDKIIDASNIWADFIALKTASSKDFDAIDNDHKGFILFSEFCEYIKLSEIKYDTDIGRELSIGNCSAENVYLKNDSAN